MDKRIEHSSARAQSLRGKAVDLGDDTASSRASLASFRRLPGKGVAAALTVVLASTTLSGCAWTLITTADAIGSVTQAGFAVSSQYSSPTFITGQPMRVRHVCIELNNSVNDENLVPALRVALSRYGVTSMIYNPGTAPPDCEARLTYTATLDYGHREFSEGYTRYLSDMDIRLVHGNDIVVAHYQTEGLNTDRFATTSTKLTALIKRMVLPVKPGDTALADAAPTNSTANTTAYSISTSGPAAYATTDVTAVPPAAPVYATPLPSTTGIRLFKPKDDGASAGYPSPYAGSGTPASATAATAPSYTTAPVATTPASNTWHPKDP